ncbi:hypothetical protein [Synechococcus sp. HBA1120]|uniref:hypothetical protein n=1 Tax=Synechococcus sp. HBA1120 TaxID=2508341 RepID=UPI001CF8D642|nr:hypothetical protein [Synechococcus sp. HBA1120]
MSLADGGLNTRVFRGQSHRTGKKSSRQDGREDNAPGARAMQGRRRHSSTFDLIQVY